MRERGVIPDGLAEMPPGPELSALLDGVELSEVAGADLVDVLRARARQLAHEQARFLAALAEVERCDPDAAPDEVARRSRPTEFATDEVRAALAWTRTAAERESWFAHTLLTRMPAVFAALDGGRLCRSKAWLFADLLGELSDAQIDSVCTRLLPLAGRLTTGELAARIKKLILALDPEWAARRYARAVRTRTVIGYLNEDGTATITGASLPADVAAAACANVEQLAKAAKKAGHHGRIGAIRADIYLGLLDGRWQHHTPDQIIADLLATATAGGDAQPVRQRRAGVELRVELSTLLGLDRHPGEIAGWGPVTAEVARTLAETQRDGEWRYAITDADGQLVRGGITRQRPRCDAPSTGRGGIIELQVPATLLIELATHSQGCGPWEPVVADLVAQYRAATSSPQDPAARFAGAGLRRHVQLRDRFCVHPGCRCPARQADLDHTVDHAAGGPTTENNHGPLCRHDHRLKHEGGWALHQPAPGHFTWTSPLGQRYETRPRAITTDYPPPQPRPGDDRLSHGPGWDDDGPILTRPPPKQSPPPRPAPVAADEPPF